MEAEAFTGEAVRVSPEWCASLPAGHTSPGLSDTAGGDREGLGMSPEEEERGRLWRQEHLRIY